MSVGKWFGATTLIALIDREDGDRNTLRNFGNHGVILHKIGISQHTS